MAVSLNDVPHEAVEMLIISLKPKPKHVLSIVYTKEWDSTARPSTGRVWGKGPGAIHCVNCEPASLSTLIFT